MSERFEVRHTNTSNPCPWDQMVKREQCSLSSTDQWIMKKARGLYCKLPILFSLRILGWFLAIFCLFVFIILLFLTEGPFSRSVEDESVVSPVEHGRITVGSYCFTRHDALRSGAEVHTPPCFPLDVNYSNYSGLPPNYHFFSLLDGVITLEQRRVGIYATFDTSRIPPAPIEVKRRHSHYAKLLHSPSNRRAQLRVVVQLSGHLRTFQKCAPSLKGNILTMNEAELFIATYPNLGHRRRGLTGILEEDPPLSSAEMQDVIYHYRPHLAGMFLLDSISMREYMKVLFSRKVLESTIWAWNILQFFTTELAHDMSIAESMREEISPAELGDNLFFRFTCDRVLYTRSGYRRVTHAPFDIVIRLRPDLYIMGPLWVEPLLTVEQQQQALTEWRRVKPSNTTVDDSAIVRQSFAVYFMCGNTSYLPFVVPPRHVARSPYHPEVPAWVSDFSAIVSMYPDGKNNVPTTVFRMFHNLTLLSPEEQEKRMMFRYNSAEGMLMRYLEHERYRSLRLMGWHFALRNKEVFYNSSVPVGKNKKTRLLRKVFEVTNVSEVRCPSLG